MGWLTVPLARYGSEAGGHTLAGCEMITDMLKGNNSHCNKLARGTQKLEKMADRPSLNSQEDCEPFNDPERAERPETALFSRK